MADDSFYYFVLARNFVESGAWTFDGVEPASGFHPLWAYLTALLIRLAPEVGVSGLFWASSIVGLVCFGAAAWIAARLLDRLYGDWAGLAVAWVFLASPLSTLATVGVESPLVLVAGAAAMAIAFAPVERRFGAGRLVLAIAVGALGMMARTDFGLWPAVLFASTLAAGWRGPARDTLRMWRRRSGALLAGAFVGLGAIMLHTRWISGSFVQTSARMKHHWSELAGHPAGPALDFAARSVGGWIVLVGVVVTSILVIRRKGHSWAPLAAGAVAMVGYAGLYVLNSQAIQPWYSASFAVPAMLLIAPGMAGVVAALRTPAARSRIIALRAGAVGLLVLSLVQWTPNVFRSWWPHQPAMFSAGVYLADHGSVRPVGAWNAGLIAWAATRPVTNLDGLVNDSIHAHAVSGSLLDYVARRRLAWIVDYEAMLDDPTLARRGGYGDGHLAACLEPVHTFGLGSQEWVWSESRITLWKVASKCMASGTSTP